MLKKKIKQVLTKDTKISKRNKVLRSEIYQKDLRQHFLRRSVEWNKN